MFDYDVSVLLDRPLYQRAGLDLEPAAVRITKSAHGLHGCNRARVCVSAKSGTVGFGKTFRRRFQEIWISHMDNDTCVPGRYGGLRTSSPRL